MSGITGLGTTYNLPNYTGETISITPSETLCSPPSVG